MAQMDHNLLLLQLCIMKTQQPQQPQKIQDGVTRLGACYRIDSKPRPGVEAPLSSEVRADLAFESINDFPKIVRFMNDLYFSTLKTWKIIALEIEISETTLHSFRNCPLPQNFNTTTLNKIRKWFCKYVTLENQPSQQSQPSQKTQPQSWYLTVEAYCKLIEYKNEQKTSYAKIVKEIGICETTLHKFRKDKHISEASLGKIAVRYKNMVFPPKEILEKANANIEKTRKEWGKLGEPKANPQIIFKYLETKEAQELYQKNSGERSHRKN